jgi:hypothetical protein
LERIRTSRTWVTALVLGTWLVSAVAIWVSTNYHPAADATVSLSLNEVQFQTDARKLFSNERQKEVLLGGIKSLVLNGDQLRSVINQKPSRDRNLAFSGSALSRCNFSNISFGELDNLEGQNHPTVRLMWNPEAGRKTISFSLHESLAASGTSQPSASDSRAGHFTCSDLTDQAGMTVDIYGDFSKAGGDTVRIVLGDDSQVDLTPESSTAFGDTQIHVLSTIDLRRIDPESKEPKSILLDPKNLKNEAVFSAPAKTVEFSSSDLLELEPSTSFYLRRVEVDNGIRAEFSGRLSDLRSGPGEGTIVTRMPSLFDHFKGQEVVWAMIASVAAAIIGILEKAGILPGEKKKVPTESNTAGAGTAAQHAAAGSRDADSPPREE